MTKIKTTQPIIGCRVNYLTEVKDRVVIGL